MFDYDKWLDTTRIAIRVKKDNEIFYVSHNWKSNIDNALVKSENLTRKDLFLNRQYARESLNELLTATDKYHKILCDIEYVEV